MVSDASKKKAAQKKAAAAAKRGGKAAATSSKAAAAADSQNGGVDKLSNGIGDLQISDRTCTGILCSHPQSRDIRLGVTRQMPTRAAVSVICCAFWQP
ncbi:hypothetical protein OIU77_028077 [Salix suchowensis]|uniref:Uncharacterized protein n=1 Tax=Salix suchowensis TaxID=1278906 RepID=A0ABQ9BJD4_9ROSI|nr:hypothetical protein OIU77_028077 [Salix suchowensis]